jgi:hydrogenase expression/formation protein HypC
LGRGEGEGKVISMCLGVPGKILEIQKNIAKVDVGGVLRDISLDLCPEVSIGEYVLIHTGFAIQKVDEEEAKETLELLKKMAEAI